MVPGSGPGFHFAIPEISLAREATRADSSNSSWDNKLSKTAHLKRHKMLLK